MSLSPLHFNLALYQQAYNATETACECSIKCLARGWSRQSLLNSILVSSHSLFNLLGGFPNIGKSPLPFEGADDISICKHKIKDVQCNQKSYWKASKSRIQNKHLFSFSMLLFNYWSWINKLIWFIKNCSQFLGSNQLINNHLKESL